MNKEDLLQHLEFNTHVLEIPLLKEAFSAIDRADFLDEDYKIEAYEDYALPIGHGQTISQPTTVAYMLELLNALPGQNILDVGSGSGWTTALLAHMVGDEGMVLGVEIIHDFVLKSSERLALYKFKNAEIIDAKKEIGCEDRGPYDRILVSASTEAIPVELISQLNPGGILVIPILNSIHKLTLNEEGQVEEEVFPGFSFIPLNKRNE